MIYDLNDAMDAIQGELARHGDGDVELDVWENKTEETWYASLRRVAVDPNHDAEYSETRDVITIDGDPRRAMIDNGPTMRAAMLALARRIERSTQ